MKLSTHNLLMCNKKTCVNSDLSFPLKIVADKIEEKQEEFDEERVKCLFNKLDINALNSALCDLNLQKYDLLNLNDDIKNSNEFWMFIHHILFEYNIIEGKFICKNCKREYPIFKGIPDMVLQDDEL